MSPTMTEITSAANPRYRQWLKLAHTPRAVRTQGLTLAEGIHLANAALDAGAQPQAVVVRRGAHVGLVQPILDRIRDVPVFQLSAALYDELAPVEQGVGLLLVLEVIDQPHPDAVASDVVYLDGIQDPGNAGAVLRVAAAAGVGHVWTSPSTTALWAPKVLRGGQGAHFALQLSEGIEPEALGALKNIFWTATLAHDAPSLWHTDFPSAPVGWMFGSEGQGLSQRAKALCRIHVSIPISVAVESLNVATSAAVCLFERKRRVEAVCAAS